MKIERVEVRVVAPKVQRFTWSHDLPEQHMTNTVVRIFTDDGVRRRRRHFELHVIRLRSLYGGDSATHDSCVDRQGSLTT